MLGHVRLKQRQSLVKRDKLAKLIHRKREHLHLGPRLDLLLSHPGVLVFQLLGLFERFVQLGMCLPHYVHRPFRIRGAFHQSQEFGLVVKAVGNCKHGPQGLQCHPRGVGTSMTLARARGSVRLVGRPVTSSNAGKELCEEGVHASLFFAFVHHVHLKVFQCLVCRYVGVQRGVPLLLLDHPLGKQVGSFIGEGAHHNLGQREEVPRESVVFDKGPHLFTQAITTRKHPGVFLGLLVEVAFPLHDCFEHPRGKDRVLVQEFDVLFANVAASHTLVP